MKVASVALDRAYEAAGAHLARLWAKNRDVAGADHVRAILDAVDPQLADRLPAETRQALLDAYARPILLVPPAVDDGARPALQRLRAEGRVLAVISNIMRTPGATLRTLLERYGLLEYFAHLTFSDELGVRKPDPEIFVTTLRALGVEAEATVHVGDDPVLDVHGAHGAGLRAIQVTSGAASAAAARAPEATISRLAALPDAIAALER